MMNIWKKEDVMMIDNLYEEGSKVQGIDNDYRWKQLKQKLSPLFGKNGG